MIQSLTNISKKPDFTGVFHQILLDIHKRNIPKYVELIKEPPSSPPTEAVLLSTSDRLENLTPKQRRVEDFALKTRATIMLCNDIGVLYLPGPDTIYIPWQTRFPNNDFCCMAILRELVNLTGHESRINRATPADSWEGMSDEEAFADAELSLKEHITMYLGTAFLCDMFEIPAREHYLHTIDSWLKYMQRCFEEHKDILQESHWCAVEACHYLMNLARSQ